MLRRSPPGSLLVMVLLLAGCDSEPEADAGVPGDAGQDAGTSDSGTSDSGTSDSGTSDSGTSDAGRTDAGATLSARHPGDEGLADDPAVLFFDDFEDGWGRWDGPTEDTGTLTIRSTDANSGTRHLRSRVTTADLQADEYISSSTRVQFPRRVNEVFVRFYARFPVVAPNPHHWVRLAAGNGTWNGSGRANTVPAGGDGFWFDFDINNDDVFNFYAYWHEMRSGRCNDGSTTEGCAGDQGSTYHYGNVFRPPAQTPYTREVWTCIEIAARANTVGASDGRLAFFVEEALVGEYGPGTPDGTWLRDQFHAGGCEFSACTEPTPFEGFNFRTDEAVGFDRFFLDAYYERGSTQRRREQLEERGLTLADEQTIDYDDVVIAEERIGCRVE